jgi:hypothetical protein
MRTPKPLPVRFSDELEPRELVQFMLILYEISKARDFIELSRFVKLVAEVIGPADFNLLLRSTVKLMGVHRCGRDMCSDWLMTQLYELYQAFGTEQTESL